MKEKCIYYIFKLIKLENTKIACVAGVERGRGRGNLGARESAGHAG